MKFTSTEILIFGLAALFLIFSLILWFGRPKIDSSKKKIEEKTTKKTIKKNVRKNRRNKN